MSSIENRESIDRILSKQESSENGQARFERSFNALMRSLPEEFGIKEDVIRFFSVFEGDKNFLTPRQRLEYAAAEAVLRTVLSVNPSFIDISKKGDVVPATVFLHQSVFQEYVDRLIIRPRTYAVIRQEIETKYRVDQTV